MPINPPPSGTTSGKAALDFITLALQLDGIVAAGETPSAEDAALAFSLLNMMMDAWNTERLLIYTIRMDEFPLTVGQQTYTLGPGGDFDMDRPPKIERMSIVNLNNPAQPLELPVEYLTVAQWQAVPVKVISSTLPLAVYDDQAYPRRNLTFRYVPSVQVNTRIYSWSALGQFANLSTQYAWPPGYQRAISYNLAIELAAGFGVAVRPEVAAIAMESKGNVKRINQPLIDLRCDPMVAGGGRGKQIYNWLTDNATGR